ncbi:hypothetical protein Gotur_017520 [Gossypium turneri]
MAVQAVVRMTGNAETAAQNFFLLDKYLMSLAGFLLQASLKVCSFAAFVKEASLKVMFFSSVSGKSAAKVMEEIETLVSMENNFEEDPLEKALDIDPLEDEEGEENTALIEANPGNFTQSTQFEPNFVKFSGKDTRSHKRTRSSKTTPENPILIDEEVKERFDSIFKHQPMMSEKGFDLKSNDLMVVPILIRKKINALKLEQFCDARSLPDNELVREFYASLTTQDATEVIVRKKKVPLTSKSINDLLNLPDVEEDEIPMDYKKVWEPFLSKRILKTSSKEKSINVEKIILKDIHNCAKKKAGRCITIYDLERLIERVHELNQGEQEEATEPNTEESTDGTETEANSVIDTKEEESDKELNIPNPRVEPEEEPVKLSVEPEYTTPMLTSTNAIFETWTEDTDDASRDGAK